MCALDEALGEANEHGAELVRYVELEGGHGELMVALMSRSPMHELPQLARLFVYEVTRRQGQR